MPELLIDVHGVVDASFHQLGLEKYDFESVVDKIDWEDIYKNK